VRYPARTVALLAGLALAGPVVPLAARPASASSDPVEDAREAARRVPFTARLEVRWVDQAGLHTAELGVRAVGGHIRVQSPSGVPGVNAAAGTGLGEGSTLVLQASAVSPVGGPGDLLAPALERKYDVERTAGPRIAGRDTDLFILRAGGQVREQLAIDPDTGLVLRREVFGPEGRPVRILTVLQLDTAPVPEPSDAGGTTYQQPRSVRVGHLPSAYRGPDGLAGGYRRVAAYRNGRLVHLLYSDGLHGMSLFSQPGTLAGGTLPKGGQPVQVGTATGVHYTWPGGDVVTWEDGAVVHTLVGDGTSADLLAAARSLPRPPRPSVTSRLRGTARELAELVSGGR